MITPTTSPAPPLTLMMSNGCWGWQQSWVTPPLPRTIVPPTCFPYLPIPDLLPSSCSELRPWSGMCASAWGGRDSMEGYLSSWNGGWFSVRPELRYISGSLGQRWPPPSHAPPLPPRSELRAPVLCGGSQGGAEPVCAAGDRHGDAAAAEPHSCPQPPSSPSLPPTGAALSAGIHAGDNSGSMEKGGIPPGQLDQTLSM